MRALLPCLLVACGTPSEQADRQALVEALRQAPPEMVTACGEIHRPALASECLAQAGAALAPDDFPRAWLACTQAPEGMWRDECFFLVSDGATLTGDKALEVCAQSGRYKARCVQHAAHRELAAESAHLAPGEELALREEARQIVGRYNPELGPRDLESVVDAAVAQVLAARWDPAPFRETDCGEVSPHVCEMAYGAHVHRAKERGLVEQICAAGADLPAVAAGGALAWEGEDRVPRRAWREACKGR